MDVRLFLAIAAVIAVVYGIGLILIPSVVLGLYGVESSASAVLGFRYFGATLLSLGLATWIIRESSDWTAIRGLLISNAAGNIVGPRRWRCGDAHGNHEWDGMVRRPYLSRSAAGIFVLPFGRCAAIGGLISASDLPSTGLGSAALDCGHPAFFDRQR